MDMTPTYWEENSNNQRVKYESCSSHDEAPRMKDERGVYACCDTNLNFSTATCSEDDCEYGPYKKNKVVRQDPMSHRIIEKRRRDRMNNCLADLSRLIPTEYLKKGRGRIEKTEIIEMAIKYMKCLQQDHATPAEHYRLGYQECMSEVMRFMVEVEGHFPREAVCVRLLNHLQKHCESISRAAAAFDSDRRRSGASEHIVPGPNAADAGSNGSSCKAGGFAGAKTEPEHHDNNGAAFIVGPIIVEDATKIDHSPDMDYEKQQPESNGVLYKYKTNIKMRFSQDVNGGMQETPKRQKLENGRRTSLTSIENQSSSHSSPPSSEPCPRISDADTHPSDSASSTATHPKSEPSQPQLLKHNFNVPIFALHAKGSYYVPLTVDYQTLAPFLQNFDILEVAPSVRVLHPVTINVNFAPDEPADKFRGECNRWH